MAFSKVILNGTTLMDVTSDTVAANNLLSGYTATGADGEAVAGAYVAPTFSTQAKTGINPATSSQTITPDAGYDGLSSVQINAMPNGTAGTPTATKSAVNNHAVTVTPSVTNSTGYITGGTKTGTAISVSASELVSGSQNITENDTYDVTNLAEVVVNVSGGGEVPQIDASIESGVIFLDYDGTIVEEWAAADVSGKSALPSNPTHTGLTAQGWNWALLDIKDYISTFPYALLAVGQMYNTATGDTEIDVSLDADHLAPYIGIAPNGTVLVDWGDNSATDTLSGSSLSTLKWVGHNYSSAGEYTITLSVSSGTFGFYTTSNLNGAILSHVAANNNSRYYADTITAIRVGDDAVLQRYPFCNLTNLVSITLPKDCTTTIGDRYFTRDLSLKTLIIPTGVTSITTYPVQYNDGMRFMSIPHGVTSLGSYAVYECSRLRAVCMPKTVTSLGTYGISTCWSIQEMPIPPGITSIPSYAFNMDYGIRYIKIPSSVTTISANAFYNCYTVKKYRFESLTPPTVSASSAFTGIQTGCVISVPVGSLSAYTSASNYPSSSTYTYIEEA